MAAKKVYGPYKGSKANGGRPIMVIKSGGKTTSTNAARYKYEKETGSKLSKGTHVDHKDNNFKHGGLKNLQAMKASKNIGKGNQHRGKK